MCDSEAPDFAGCLSVVVPMRDEADNVLPLLDEIDAALQGLRDDEVIFAGMAVATRPPRAWPRPGRPIPAACAAPAPGLRAEHRRCTRPCGARHLWIATLDGDGQNACRSAALLEAVSAGRRQARLELVVGWRTCAGRLAEPCRAVRAALAAPIKIAGFPRDMRRVLSTASGSTPCNAVLPAA